MAWWRERKGDVAKRRQARYRRSIADSETRHPPGNRGQRSVAVFRDGFRWQLIGTERTEQGGATRADQRPRSGSSLQLPSPGSPSGWAAWRWRRASRTTDARTGNGSAGQSRAECTSAPAAAWHRDATSRWPRGGPCRGHASAGRKIPPTRNPGTPGRARGARWIGNNGTGPLVPGTGRTSAAAGGNL